MRRKEVAWNCWKKADRQETKVYKRPLWRGDSKSTGFSVLHLLIWCNWKNGYKLCHISSTLNYIFNSNFGSCSFARLIENSNFHASFGIKFCQYLQSWKILKKQKHFCQLYLILQCKKKRFDRTQNYFHFWTFFWNLCVDGNEWAAKLWI